MFNKCCKIENLTLNWARCATALFRIRRECPIPPFRRGCIGPERALDSVEAAAFVARFAAFRCKCKVWQKLPRILAPSIGRVTRMVLSQKVTDAPRLIGRTKGDLNTKLQALCGKLGRPVWRHRTKGQRSDLKSADRLLKDLPKTDALLGNRGYDSKKSENCWLSKRLHLASRPR